MDRKIKHGLTLIELLVTISILSILVGIGLYSYKSYSDKRDLENDIYKIFSLASKARVSAFTDKENYYIYIAAGGLKVIMDNNTSESDGYMEKVDLKKKFISDNSSYLFDKSGFLKSSGKIYPEEVYDVQYNCILFSDMVYLGQLNGANCEKK